MIAGFSRSRGTRCSDLGLRSPAVTKTIGLREPTRSPDRNKPTAAGAAGVFAGVPMITEISLPNRASKRYQRLVTSAGRPGLMTAVIVRPAAPEATRMTTWLFLTRGAGRRQPAAIDSAHLEGSCGADEPQFPTPRRNRGGQPRTRHDDSATKAVTLNGEQGKRPVSVLGYSLGRLLYPVDALTRNIPWRGSGVTPWAVGRFRCTLGWRPPARWCRGPSGPRSRFPNAPARTCERRRGRRGPPGDWLL
jgi:hypothetical protein